VLMGLIGAYQRWISPFLGNRCRFHPSCSVYAKTAVETHGALRGFDYVPPATRRVKPGPRGYGDMVSGGQVGPPERGSS
jgi:putative membrane protein insertion efficiency factor